LERVSAPLIATARLDPALRPASEFATRLSGEILLRRPERVYSLDELEGDASAPPQATLFARAVRVTSPRRWNAALIILRLQSDFTAADGALVSALAPHLSIALGHYAAAEHAKLGHAVAAALLRRLGVSWEIGEAAKSHSETSTGATLAFPTRPARAASDGPDGATDAQRLEISVDGVGRHIIVSRNNPRLHEGQSRVLEQLWGLSSSEARLALAIASGQSLAEGAEAIGLTLESARNYSKRIYSKTGAHGQADLVRLVVSSVAMLC
jgi:DNA-binding CsgD family transcriptional regulator